MHQRSFLALGVTTIIFSAGPVAWAQSLADLARTEEARRKAVQTPSKVYTNEDLRPGRDPAPPSQPASPGAAAAALAAAPKEAVIPAGPPPAPPEPPKDEAYWRGRMTAVRAALDRNIVFLEALQTRVNSLTTDFTNMDDPAQRAVIEQNRLRVLSEMERLKREIADQSKLVADIEDEARRAAVPPGWLR